MVGAQALARAEGLDRIITFDMGGTTAKASMVEDGEVTRAQEYAVGAGIMIGSRLLTGAGYTLKVPAIDLAEVGAGGGSHVWIDAGGALQVGPQSAGASPGPVCYDQGGEVPTITDANVVLGYINPRYLIGGAVAAQRRQGAARVCRARSPSRWACALERAAYGAHRIAASNMIRAIKAVSTERGRDPREFALFAFGGNGPLFACGMAAALGMTRVVVPPSAGLFSSFGLLYADIEHHYSRTFRRLLRGARPRRDRRSAWRAARRQALQQLAAEGFTGARTEIRRSAACTTRARASSWSCRCLTARSTPQMARHLEEAFGAEHERTYGHRAGPEEPVELVSIQVVGAGLRDGIGRAGARHARPRHRAAPRPAAPRLFRRHARLARDARRCAAPISRRTRRAR